MCPSSVDPPILQGACDRPLGTYPTLANRTHTPIVQAYYSSKYLGLIKINLSKRRLVPGVLPLLLGGANSSNNVQQDPELLGIIQKYRAPVDELQTQIAGVWVLHAFLVTIDTHASSVSSWHCFRLFRCPDEACGPKLVLPTLHFKLWAEKGSV
jgi:hypothetical protein